MNSRMPGVYRAEKAPSGSPAVTFGYRNRVPISQLAMDLLIIRGQRKGWL